MKTLKLSPKLQSVLLDQEKFPVPKSFCFNKKNVKVIVLGCDPSNFSNNNKPNLLSIVFGIGSGDHRYFRDILNNLKEIGLGLEDIYVQNVVPFYMKKETSKNSHWDEIADTNLPNLIKELDSFNPRRTVPVFMTSEIIYKFLLLDNKNYINPKELYKNVNNLPIDKNINKLGRKLFPLYRHYRYRLNSTYWVDYSDLLGQSFNE